VLFIIQTSELFMQKENAKVERVKQFETFTLILIATSLKEKQFGELSFCC